MNALLEVCVDSLASARAAIAGGADRLELCSALSVGGLTPWAPLLSQIRQESNIPIRCLMRPRPGDFLYTKEEVEMLACQIRTLKDLGADGFVIGCLKADGSLDTNAMTPLLEAADGSGLTLHRCIDVSRDPKETYLRAWKLGIDTILTSGCAPSCRQGLETIRELISLRDTVDGPEVLIGAGVNADVIRLFRREIPGASAFHLSGKIELPSGMTFRREGIPMGVPGLDEWHLSQTDSQAVSLAKEALCSY